MISDTTVDKKLEVISNKFKKTMVPRYFITVDIWIDTNPEREIIDLSFNCD